MIKGTIDVGTFVEKRITNILDLAIDDVSTERAKYVVQVFVNQLFVDDNELVVFAGELLRLSFQKKNINGTIAEVFRNPQMLTTQLMIFIFEKYNFPCPTSELRNFFERCHNLRKFKKIENAFLNANEVVIRSLLPLYYEYITLSLGKIIKQSLEKIFKQKEQKVPENLPQLNFSFNKKSEELEIQLQYHNQEVRENLLKKLSVKKIELTKTFLSQISFPFVETLAMNLPDDDKARNLQLTKEFGMLKKLDVMQGLAKRLDEIFLTYHPSSFQDKLDEVQIIKCYDQAIAEYSSQLEKLIKDYKKELNIIKEKAKNIQSCFTSDSEGYKKINRIINEIDTEHIFHNSYQISECKSDIIKNFQSVIIIIYANKDLKHATRQDVKAIRECLGLRKKKQKRESRGFIIPFSQGKYNEEEKGEESIPRSSKRRSRIKSERLKQKPKEEKPNEEKSKKEFQRTLTINYDRKNRDSVLNESSPSSTNYSNENITSQSIRKSPM